MMNGNMAHFDKHDGEERLVFQTEDLSSHLGSRIGFSEYFSSFYGNLFPESAESEGRSNSSIKMNNNLS
jgi:hypothetical protein